MLIVETKNQPRLGKDIPTICYDRFLWWNCDFLMSGRLFSGQRFWGWNTRIQPSRWSKSSPWKEILGHLKSPFRLFFLGGWNFAIWNTPEIERIDTKQWREIFQESPPNFQVVAMTSGFPATLAGLESRKQSIELTSRRNLHNVEEFPPQQLTNESKTPRPCNSIVKAQKYTLED